MNKTKVMISGERQQVRQKAVRWPCGVCSITDWEERCTVAVCEAACCMEVRPGP